jgi:hypothetical protein
MKFTFEKASQLANEYKLLLKDKPLNVTDGGFKIEDVIVAPGDYKLFGAFLDHWLRERDYTVALDKCGYKSLDYSVIAVHYNGNLWYSELDKYLTTAKLYKSYSTDSTV